MGSSLWLLCTALGVELGRMVLQPRARIAHEHGEAAALGAAYRQQQQVRAPLLIACSGLGLGLRLGLGLGLESGLGLSWG